MLKGVSILFILIHFFQAFNSPEGGHSLVQQLFFSIPTPGEIQDNPEKNTTPLKTTQHASTDFEKEDTGAENDLINHFGLLTSHSIYTALCNRSIGKATFRMKDQLHADIQTPPPDDQLVA